MAYHAVIMAGGAGTRLWPLSRKDSPKQFQKFIGDRTLVQQTYDRIIEIVDRENIWVVTGESNVDTVKRQLPEISDHRIITEPLARNTAPAACLAIFHVLKEDPAAIMFGILPADHHIGKPEVFAKTTAAAFKFLEKNRDYIVTIGINPTEPSTGLGYIRMGEQLGLVDKEKIFKVDSFHEKPDLVTAQHYIEQWEYLWNGGYYLYSAAHALEHFRRLAPEVTEKIEQFVDNPSDAGLYATIPAVPFDVAISEKLETLAVLPADMEWSDIGSWSTLHEILSHEGELHQVVVGKHVGVATNRSLIFSTNKLIATVGLEDVVIVETDDAILVARREAVQDVKKIVEQLQEQNLHQYL